jgi:hypothetical protein
MFYVKLGERQESTIGKTPSKHKKKKKKNDPITLDVKKSTLTNPILTIIVTNKVTNTFFFY